MALLKREWIAGEAHVFAVRMHDGQKRANGDDYVVHPERCARRVRELGGSEEQVAAIYIHDVSEDCGVPFRVINYIFGAEVAKLVEELTNHEHSPNMCRADRKMADRVRLVGVSREAKFLKLIDRIDNLKDIEDKSPEFARLYRQESRLLLDNCLRGVHPELEKELEALCQDPRDSSST
ncbi:MAG: HD domain-containing protein [Armatimonadia bacterium]